MKNTNLPRLCRALSLTIAAITVCLPAQAQTVVRTWDGEGSDILWNNATNWSGDTVPLTGSNGIAVFDSTSPLAAPTVDLGGNRFTGTLVISNVANGVIVTGSTGNLLTLAGGGIDMSAATDDLTFTNSTGWALSGNGSINVATGRTLTWTTGSRLNGASNTLTGEGTKTGNFLMLATAVGSSNMSTMSAGTLNLTVTGMSVGFATNSTATFFQTGGTVNITGGGINIGQQVGSSGTYELSGGTLNITSGNLSVGQSSNAASAIFRQTGGTVSLGTGINALVGTGAGSSNNLLEISGGNFTQAPGGALFSVGRNSDATATISGTANVSVNNLHVVDTVAASGTDAVLNINGGTFSAATIASIANNTAGGSTAVINLNGGVAELPALPSARSAGSTAIINFNGGVLRPAAASAAYLSGFTEANLTANGAIFEVLSGRDITVAQVLQNATAQAGTLRLDGSGVLTLTASNTFTGGTTVSSNGVLRAGSAAALGSGTITLGNGATLASDSSTARTLTNNFVATGSSVTFGQASGGTGNLTLGAPGQSFDIGTGNLTLNTAVASVSLNAALTNSGSITKTGAGVLQLNAANSFNGLTIAEGVVAVVANAGVAGTLGSGNVTNNATLRFARNAANTTNTFANIISGSGSIEKTNATTVILTGDNSYSGTTTVTGGALIINGDQSGATGALSVGSGATLGGSGTIGGNTLIQSGGTLAPGNSPGVLTVLGDLTLEGAVVMELNGLGRGTEYDGINVGGILTYGGTLTLNFGTTFNAGGSFNLFQFDTGNSTNSFASISLAGSYDGSLTRNGNTWTGTISGLDFAFYEETGNLDVVPEPSTVSLLVIAGLGLAGHVLRRRGRARDGRVRQ